MDEKDKKIKELEDQLKVVTGERDAKASEVSRLEGLVKDKDLIIEQKNQDIIGARKTYKKLAEMTQEEKDQLSEAEIQLIERQEKFEKDQEEFKKQQEEVRAKEVASRRGQIISKLVGGNAELAKKVEENFGKIKDSDKAITEEEIKPFVDSAYNMLGELKPNPVEQNLNNADGEAGAPEGGSNFAETKEGKALEQALGLPVEPEKK